MMACGLLFGTVSANVEACSVYHDTQTIKLRDISVFPDWSTKGIIPPLTKYTWLKKDARGKQAFEVILSSGGSYTVVIGPNMAKDYLFKVIVNGKDSVYIPLAGPSNVCQLIWNVPQSAINRIDFETYELKR